MAETNGVRLMFMDLLRMTKQKCQKTYGDISGYLTNRAFMNMITK